MYPRWLESNHWTSFWTSLDLFSLNPFPLDPFLLDLIEPVFHWTRYGPVFLSMWLNSNHWTRFGPIFEPLWTEYLLHFQFSIWLCSIFMTIPIILATRLRRVFIKLLWDLSELWYFENLVKVILAYVNWFSISKKYFPTQIAPSWTFNFWNLSTRSQKELTMNWTKSCHLEWYWWITFWMDRMNL